MKKITSILASFLVLFGMSLQAAPTDLPKMSTEGSTEWYALKNVRSGKYATFAGDNAKMVQTEKVSYLSAFYFEGEIKGDSADVKIFNGYNGAALANFSSWNADGIIWTMKASTQEDKVGLAIYDAPHVTGGWNALNDEGKKTVGPYLVADAGSVWETVALNVENIKDMKAEVKAQFESLKNLNAIYGDVSAVVQKVEAVAETDISKAVAELGTIVKDFYAQADGKGLYFQNQAGEKDSRHGLYLGVDKANNRGAGLQTKDEDSFWYIQHNFNGTFKLYNLNNNKYLGAPGDPTNLTDVDKAGAFTFLTTGDNVTTLVIGNAMVHCANHSNFKLINYYSTTDAASLWAVTVDNTSIKDFVNSQLNAAEHAENPALNQYPTAVVEAAKSAVESATEFSEVGAAYVEFKNSLNTPVYIIKSAAQDLYCSGSAIYWDGKEMHFKDADRYDNAMWFKVYGATEPTIKVDTEYTFVNWISGSNLYGSGSVTTKAIEGWDGAFCLHVTGTDAAGENYVHAQDYNKKVVTWAAATIEANQASAWNIEYIGNSYDLLGEVETIAKSKELLNNAAVLRAVPGAVGTKAYFANASSLEAYDAAVAALKAGMNNIEAYEALNSIYTSVVDSKDVVAFDANKFYRLQNVMRGGNLEANEEGKLAQNNANAANVNSLWTIASLEEGKNIVIKHLNSGKVINDFQTVGDANETLLLHEIAPGEFGLHKDVEGKDMYLVQFQDGGIGSWNTPSKGGDHGWYLVPVETIEVNMNRAEEGAAESWASLYLPFGVKVAGVQAFAGKVNGDVMNLTEVSEVPANYGVILKGTDDVYTLEIANVAASAVANDLTGSNVQVAKVAGSLVLGNGEQGVGMYAPAGEVMKANKAFVNAPAAVNGLKFVFGEATGVEGVEVETENAVYYDLSGRRVANPVKGIYVVNGKKVLVK